MAPILAGCMAWNEPSQDALEGSVPSGALLRIVDEIGRPIDGAAVYLGKQIDPPPETPFPDPTRVLDLPTVRDMFVQYLLTLAGPERLRDVTDGCDEFGLQGYADAAGLFHLAAGEDGMLWIADGAGRSSGIVNGPPDRTVAGAPCEVRLRPRGIVRIAVADFRSSTRGRKVVFNPEPPGTSGAVRCRQPDAVELDEFGEAAIEVDAPCVGSVFLEGHGRWGVVGRVAVDAGAEVRVAWIVDATASISGEVRDGAGLVSDGTVRTFPWWSAMGATCSIDSRGRFELRVPVSASAISIEALGSRFMSPELTEVVPDRDRTGLVMNVSRAVFISGVVLGHDGLPLSGVRIDVSVGRQASLMQALRSLAGAEGHMVTTESGRFGTGALVPGCRYVVTARSDGGGFAEARDVVPGTAGLELRLQYP